MAQTPASKPSLFGGAGATAGSSSLFGSTTPAANAPSSGGLFGTPAAGTTSLFGSNAQKPAGSLFGSAAPASGATGGFSFKPAGAATTQAAASPSLFGNSTGNASGGTAAGGLFGGGASNTLTATPQSKSLFSTSTTPAGEPPANTASNGSAFSFPKPTGNLFGASTGQSGGQNAQASNPFGAAPASSAATTTSAAPSPFGAKPSGSLFGGQTGSSLFGNTSSASPAASSPATTAAPSLFGSKPAAPSLFGNTASQSAVSAASTGATTVATTAAAPAKSLFGSTPAQTPASSAAAPSGGLLAAATPAGGAPAASSLFGRPATTAASAAPAVSAAPATTTATSLFGSAPASSAATAAASTASTATSTAAAPKPAGSLFGAAAPAAAAPAAAAPAKPADTSTAAAAAAASTIGPLPPAQSRLKNKSMEEIINRWASDLTKYQREFQSQAEKVAAWDQLLVQNGSKIQKLYVDTIEAERSYTEVERQLNHVEQQQDELSAWLDRYEQEADELFQRQVGAAESLQGPDHEREKTYKTAEKLSERLDDMGKDLRAMIEEINSASATLGKTTKTEDPLSQIVRVLNGHLTQLRYIDQNASTLQSKIQAAQASSLSVGSNGFASGDSAADDFYKSFSGRRS